MICIPIMPRSNAEAHAMLTFAAAEPADIYELRFDRLEEAPDVEGLVAASDRPVIATCRSSRQGGFFGGTSEARLAILQRAMDAGAAYVDAEHGTVHLHVGCDVEDRRVHRRRAARPRRRAQRVGPTVGGTRPGRADLADEVVRGAYDPRLDGRGMTPM